MAGVTPDGEFGPKTFKAAQKFFELSDIQAVHFFAQCAHETGEFTAFEENLNYSKDGLLATWPSRYSEELAKSHHRNPELIANHVYNRKSLGNTSPGDGWKYRGRGAIQLTGKANYTKFVEEMSESFPFAKVILEIPDRVAEEYSFVAAMWFFEEKGIFEMCIDYSRDTIKKITKRINGGYNGLDHRIELTRKYQNYV